MTFAVFLAPLFPAVVVGGFFYPKQSILAAVLVLSIITWRMLASAGEQAATTVEL